MNVKTYDGPHIAHHDDGRYVSVADYATLESENAKLRDLLRRVVVINGAACDAGELEEAIASICVEIKAAIEPSGEPGELGGE